MTSVNDPKLGTVGSRGSQEVRNGKQYETGEGAYACWSGREAGSARK